MLDWLSGKKTYILAVLAGVDLVGAKLGWWEADSFRASVEGILAFIFLRLGVAKSGPVS